MMRRRSRYTAELRRGITLCASEDEGRRYHTDAADSAQDERCTSADTPYKQGEVTKNFDWLHIFGLYTHNFEQKCRQ